MLIAFGDGLILSDGLPSNSLLCYNAPMLFSSTFKTLRMSKKARTVTIGERGKEQVFITPNPKPMVEVHFWVIRDKCKLGVLVILALLAGAALSILGWQMLLGGCIIGFIIGFITGGDRESGP